MKFIVAVCIRGQVRNLIICEYRDACRSSDFELLIVDGGSLWRIDMNVTRRRPSAERKGK